MQIADYLGQQRGPKLFPSFFDIGHPNVTATLSVSQPPSLRVFPLTTFSADLHQPAGYGFAVNRHPLWNGYKFWYTKS